LLVVLVLAALWGLWEGYRWLWIREGWTHSKTDYNLFEGTEVTGTPEVVLLRGQILVEGDQLVAEPGVGQFVARAKFGEELKPAPRVAA
jgi:hypothetical protein